MRIKALRTRRGTIAVAIACVAAAAAGAGTVLNPASAAVTLQAVRIIGGPGHADHYGWGADTIPPGIPGAGNVLISDYWNYRVAEIDPQGNLVGYVVPNNGSHFAVYDVAVNPVNGNIAIGDVDNGATVDIYSRSGTLLRQCGNPSRWTYPAWLDYDATGRLAVADSRGNKIVMVNDANCNVIFQFGSRGSGPTQFNTPRGVDFAPDGTLWVLEENNSRVSHWQVGATSATPLGRFSVQGLDRRGLLFNPDNNQLYVVNAAFGHIDRYSTTGTLVGSFGSLGTAPGQFQDGGRGITRDLDGNVWVGDMPTFRSQKFTATGDFLLTAPDGAQPPPLGGFNQPWSVAVLGDGRIAGLDSFNWRINIFSSTGTPQSAFGNRDIFNYPRGLAADRTSNTLIVGNTDASSIAKYGPNGNLIWKTTGVKPWDVAVDQVDGQIYAAEFASNRIRIINSDGTLGATFGSGLSNPRGVTVDPVDRSVWVTSFSSGLISHFSSTGTLLGSFASGASQPVGIAVDIDTVYVAAKASGTIRMYSKAGVATGTFGGAGTALGRFNGPVGLDLVGNMLYVMETGNERIQQLRINR